MREVQASEAKAHLARLLSRSRRARASRSRATGGPSHLVPAETQERAQRAQAVERFRAARAKWSRVPVSIDEILAARHEGHRF